MQNRHLLTGAALGVQANAGAAPHFHLLATAHPKYVALIEPDTAFWVLVRREEALDLLLGPELPQAFAAKEAELARDLTTVRFGLLPSAVYFNPTERCNLNCSYCYLPREMRQAGRQMTPAQLLRALELLEEYFRGVLPEGARPQLVFHGSEPLLAREAVFAGMERFAGRFRFGVQTNATLLDREAREFLVSQGAGIGLSLDGPTAAIADRTRKTWGGEGVFARTVTVLEELADYPGLNVIVTVTRENVGALPDLVEFLHARGVKNVLLNPVRGTQAGGRELLPEEAALGHHFFAALERAYDLLQASGHKLVVGNFANLLLGLVAPGARRLMCDISPCGGGRCFFAVGAAGEVTPCSEFLGLPEFHGGNLFEAPLAEILATPPFRQVTGRRVEDIHPCRRCAVRHFCGAPCPAEIHAMTGTLHGPAALCDFYAAQVRFALGVIAAGRLDAYLWDHWQENLEEIRVM
ncbi:MAG: peptide-modifying radical SAM enzyme CbpB [Syntrophobacterales bacterium]|nr:peptide-modifying radical SAM enzyme CbpB [Syntrophobacterales bacterium]